MMSECPKFFCRVHGALAGNPETTEKGTRQSQSSYKVCGWGLFALVLASAGLVFPSRFSAQGAVAWSALWIFVFPLVHRVGPRAALAWGALAASFTPLALLAFAAGGKLALPSLLTLAGLVLPVYVAAVGAALLAKLLEDLKRRATAAQQLGMYQLESRIAQGGMGEVWRARHALLSRPAAIKLIKPKRLSDGSMVVDDLSKQRFEKEAQITASLQSPHTVELYDFGETSTGTFYYVMELLEGANLEQLVEQQGPLPPARVVHILRQVLDSLAEAHARGLVHRDIKPANVVVSKRGLHEDFVKVLDFGLVQAAERVPIENDAGTIQGTPAFLAPEAVTGSAPIDARTDLYAVGCLAYWLLTGSLLFARDTPSQMAIAHAVEEPQTPSQRLGHSLPWELERLIMQCLEKDPNRRPSDALEVLARLETLAEPASKRQLEALVPLNSGAVADVGRALLPAVS